MAQPVTSSVSIRRLAIKKSVKANGDAFIHEWYPTTNQVEIPEFQLVRIPKYHRYDLRNCSNQISWFQSSGGGHLVWMLCIKGGSIQRIGMARFLAIRIDKFQQVFASRRPCWERLADRQSEGLEKLMRLRFVVGVGGQENWLVFNLDLV